MSWEVLYSPHIFVFEYTLTHAFELALEHDIVTNIAKLEQLVMVGILLDDGGRVRGSYSQDACGSFWTWHQSTNSLLLLLLHWSTSLLINPIVISRWRRHCIYICKPKKNETLHKSPQKSTTSSSELEKPGCSAML
jgi:hypothetical protein